MEAVCGVGREGRRPRSVFITGSVIHPVSHWAPPSSSSCPSQQPLLLAQTCNWSRGLKMEKLDVALASLCPFHPWVSGFMLQAVSGFPSTATPLHFWLGDDPNHPVCFSPSGPFPPLCCCSHTWRYEQNEALQKVVGKKKVVGRRKVDHAILNNWREQTLRPKLLPCYSMLYSTRHWGVWWSGGEQPSGLHRQASGPPASKCIAACSRLTVHASAATSTVAAHKGTFGSWCWKNVCCGEGSIECHGPHLRIATSVQTQKQ